VAAGLIWALASSPLLAEKLRVRRPVVAAALIVVILGTGIAVTARVGDPVNAVDTQWRSFTSLKLTDSSARFTDASGYRYDLWRIALRQFRENPLLGVGAGSYDATFFRERRVPEYVRQPHSLELQMLGELGLPGLIGLLTFVIAVLASAVRRRAELSGPERAFRVAAFGIFLTWLVHTSVDWLYNLPGLTVMALMSAGVLLAPPLGEGSRVATFAGSRSRQAFLLVVLLGAGLLAASIGRHYGAALSRDAAISEITRDPAAARDSARRSLSLNSHDPTTYYALAAAEARRGRYAEARRALLASTAEEKFNYVPWVLLGDLETRRGNLAEAQAAYSRAHTLNPLDTTISSLVRQTRAPRR
jgi:hypothetical protein